MKWLRATACSVVFMLAALCTHNAAGAQPASQSSMRQLRYTARSREQAVAWQKEVRAELFRILAIPDPARTVIAFNAKVLSAQKQDGYTVREIEINSTLKRRMKILLTVPESGGKRYPAVVCIHGHGGNRQSVHDSKTIYKGFAAALAADGFVTIATDVGQHSVYEEGRTLMGERLWDLMRCVDYLRTMPEVNRDRAGCAGLSLGGEMAMWLGAMDERIAATVSCGFLTLMDQMERGHCPCWKFPGLRERVDYADIYSLIAPRALQCQNGRKEPPTDFTPALARQAMQEIVIAYRDLGHPENVELDIHDGAHEVHLPALLAFLRKHLKEK
jgi:hypothetical protein